jgi:hypothetical protein
MTIKIIHDRITRSELKKLAEETFVEMVKAVADIRRGVIAVGGELHSETRDKLLAEGSKAQDLWGFNIYLDGQFDDALEYSSQINLRPAEHNASLQIKSPEVRALIRDLVLRMVDWEH